MALTKFGATEHTDGVRAVFDDDFWVLFRISGTEAKVRIQGEARTRRRAQSIVNEGLKAVNLSINF